MQANHTDFKKIRQKMLDLIRFRSQILSGNLPVDEMKDVKVKATTEIDTGNKILGEFADIYRHDVKKVFLCNFKIRYFQYFFMKSEFFLLKISFGC